MITETGFSPRHGPEGRPLQLFSHIRIFFSPVMVASILGSVSHLNSPPALRGENGQWPLVFLLFWGLTTAGIWLGAQRKGDSWDTATLMPMRLDRRQLPFICLEAGLIFAFLVKMMGDPPHSLSRPFLLLLIVGILVAIPGVAVLYFLFRRGARRSMQGALLLCQTGGFLWGGGLAGLLLGGHQGGPAIRALALTFGYCLGNLFWLHTCPFAFRVWAPQPGSGVTSPKGSPPEV
jgi:hypothetical protein